MLIRRICIAMTCFLFFCIPAFAQDHILLIADNLKILNCQAPTKDNRLVGTNGPCQLFYADETVTLNLALAKGTHQGPTALAIEIQEIGTRTPGHVSKAHEGWTDTSGYAPLIDLIDKPVNYDLKVTFDDKAELAVEVKDFPLPRKYGTYALILVDGQSRQILGTLARVIKPVEGGNLDNTPIFGESGLFDQDKFLDERASAYERIGVHGMRYEIGYMQKKDGTTDWSRLDKLFEPLGKHQLQVMITLGGGPSWAPFGQPTPATNWTPKTGGYGGTGDWVMDPKYYPQFGKWVTEFGKRYWNDGKGPLWGFENYNEPWEGGGISGWARDCLEYRKIQKVIAEGARAVDPRVKVCAASSIMNTEDKFYSDGTKEMDPYVDIFTDHYVSPCMCYGPMVAKAHGKRSIETETWFVGTECLLPQIVQFIACGQSHLSPWHPRVLFDYVPGVEDKHHVPAPVVVASAAFNHFVTGKSFEKIVFKDHLPWVFQFGKDSDKDGVLIVFGQLMSVGFDDPNARLWAQVDNANGGTMTLDNRDGLLQFFDIAGNPSHVGEASVTLPMTIYPTYITSPLGPATASARIAQAKIEGKRPVEILPRDFSQMPTSKGLKFNVGIHNCLTHPISGTLALVGPDSIKLAASSLPIQLNAGETKSLSFDVASITPSTSGGYPFEFHFTSDAGNADYKEIMNFAVAPKRTITIDGNLDDWKDVPGVMVVAKTQKVDPSELMRRPWLDLKDQVPDGNFAEFKVAWDDDNLYFCARVNDPTPEKELPKMEGRDENQFFHSAASDLVSPYKEFLEKYPGRSFAEVPYVYKSSPEAFVPFRRDRLQIALDVTDDWHDFTPDTDQVPYGFHTVPDTDYEYSLYQVAGGGAELWRQLAPGVPRMHDFPRQPRGPVTTGTVPGAKFIIKREGTVYTYELAIPKSELAKLKLAPGTTIGMMLRAGNSKGPHVDSAQGKAVTKMNGLTMHPYWEPKPSCGVRWTLVE